MTDSISEVIMSLATECEGMTCEELADRVSELMDEDPDYCLWWVRQHIQQGELDLTIDGDRLIVTVRT